MNKLTKVGLTALAGSLAAVTGANAGAVSFAGGADITWVSHDANSTAGADDIVGNPIGWKNNLTVTGSGELDNGVSWTANAYQSDAQALTSSNISFDLGGMGALLVDNGAGGAGLDTLDDKMPTAWEETWDAGVLAGAQTVTGVHGSASLTYTLPTDMLPGGTKIRIGYTPKADGGGLQSDKGGSGISTNDSGSAQDITVEMTPVDGLYVFAGYAEIEQHNPGTSGLDGGDDEMHGTYGFTYAMGPVQFGIQQAYKSQNTGTTTTVMYYDNVNWGVAFNVNDNLSVSYAEFESDEVLNSTGGQTLEIDSFQLAYNMGGATLKVAESSVKDADYTAGAEVDTTLIAVSLAF